MCKIRRLLAAMLLLAASCVPDDDREHSSTTEELSGATRFAFGPDVAALLSPARATLLAELTRLSTIQPNVAVEVRSTAVAGIELDVAPMGATPRDTAWIFIRRFQPLLDSRVAATDYRIVAPSGGCDNAVVLFDRFVGGTAVVGSRLTLHFDDRGHIIYVTNGVAPVPGVIRAVDPTALPGARPLTDVVGKNQKPTTRVPVLAPLPDGSGLHKADLVPFLDDRDKHVATIAVGDVAISEPIDQARDGQPAPRISPTAFVARGEAVPSFISYGDVGGLPINGLPIERNPIERAFRFLETHATVFRTGEARCQFVPRSLQQSPDGDVHVRLNQKHATTPIFGASLVMTFDGERLQSVLGHTIDNLDIASLSPARSAAEAIAMTDRAIDRGIAAAPSWRDIAEKSKAEPPQTRLGILPRWAVRTGGEVNAAADRLVWKVTRGAFTFFVDARDGQIRNAHSAIISAAIVNDARGMSELGLPFYVRESVDGVHIAGAPLNFDTSPARAGGPTGAALLTLQNTFRALGWRGLSGRGGDFVAHTNVGAITTTCPNAFFNGATRSAFFCLGEATTDIVGHEMTHGVIAASSDLVYRDESGAINEAFADVMGNMLFREPGGGWLVGELSSAGAVRNMAAPAHMATYRHRDATCDVFPWSCDNGFVHTNSAIINKAHQLLADGVPGATAGIGRDKLMMLAFATMTTRLPEDARMNDVPVAERDVCERFVARGTRDLTGAPFTRDDCNKIGTAFAEVGLAPGLTTAWSEPSIEFEGSRTFFASPLDITPGRCPVLNVEANLVQLSGAQTVDLSPTTATPTRVSWLGLSRLSLRVPPGPVPFPIGTQFKRHTVDWFAIYGVRPAFYTTVIPDPVCPPLIQQTAASATFDESHFFGNTSTTTLGIAASTIDPNCTLSDAILELVGDDGSTIGTSGATATHELVHWFLFIPIHFDESATIISAPALGGPTGPTRDLSGTLRYSYALGRHFHVRWRYAFTLPPGVTGITCTP